MISGLIKDGVNDPHYTASSCRTMSEKSELERMRKEEVVVLHDLIYRLVPLIKLAAFRSQRYRVRTCELELYGSP
jgi:hypothetical protein